MTTASRSHKLMIRVQHIEAALPPLEKVVLAQTSHIHFAYTTGMIFVPVPCHEIYINMFLLLIALKNEKRGKQQLYGYIHVN